MQMLPVLHETAFLQDEMQHSILLFVCCAICQVSDAVGQANNELA